MESKATSFAFCFYECIELEFKGKKKIHKLTKFLHTPAFLEAINDYNTH